MFMACFVLVSGLFFFCGRAELQAGDWPSGIWMCVGSLWCMLGAILIAQIEQNDMNRNV